MKLPEYVTIDEAKRVCYELNISDWTEMKESSVQLAEAETILSKVNTTGMNIELQEFQKGLEVELEHGIRFKDANVTNNHPILTGRIVLAHLKESRNYYRQLEVLELEGDLFKEIVNENYSVVKNLYQKILSAKEELYRTELEELSSPK
jgi:hypothetical protein